MTIRNICRRKTAVFTAALIAALLLTAGTASAAVITIGQPANLLTEGETATLPVTLEYAEDIAGFQFYLKETSGASIRIDPSSAAIEGLYLNAAKNKAVYYPDPDAYPPLYGTVKLFDIIATPAAGKNIDLSFDIVEVIDSQNNDITSSCIGVPAAIRVTDGITAAAPAAAPAEDNTIEWVYDTTQDIPPENAGYLPPQPAYSMPQPAASEPSSALPAYTVRPEPSSTPGFLPATLIAAALAAALIITRHNRKRGA